MKRWRLVLVHLHCNKGARHADQPGSIADLWTNPYRISN